MKKGCGAVEWMRARRVKIDDEDQGLSWEETRKKTRRLLDGDPLWQRLKARAVEPAVTPPMVVRGPGATYPVPPEQ